MFGVSNPGVAGLGAFHVTRGGTNQTGLDDGNFNKVEFTTKAIDTRGWFDNATNFRFLPLTGVPRWWFLYGQFSATNIASDCPFSVIRKNGSLALEGTQFISSGASGNAYSYVGGMIELNGSSDYVELFAYLPATVTAVSGVATRTFFGGFVVH